MSEQSSEPGDTIKFWRPHFSAVLIALVFTLIYTLVLELPRWNPPQGLKDPHYTGALAYDVPTYYANAREIFESGGILLYANPYDLQSEPPRIYFHLFTIAKGVFWRVFGAGPEVQEVVWRLIFGFLFLLLLDVFAGVYLSAVPGSRFRIFSHLLLCMGGGAVAVWTLIPSWWTWATLSPEEAVGTSLWDVWLIHAINLEDGLRFGKWLMSPARNFLFTSELYYHCILLLTLSFYLLGKHWISCLVFAVAWLSHPFTAVELAAILGPAVLLECAVQREERSRYFKFGCSLLFITIIGLLYYQVYLPSFEVHREVVKNFQLPVSQDISAAPFHSIFFIYGLFIFAVPIWYASRQGRSLLASDFRTRLLVVMSIVILLLIQHDKFFFIEEPVQPLHFGRGYLWLALALLFLKALTVLFESASEKVRQNSTYICIVLAALFSLDTLQFYASFPRIGTSRFEAQAWIDGETWEVMEFLNEKEPATFATVEVAPMTGLGYLLPTWTPHKTLLAHGCNTPYLFERVNEFRDIMEDPTLVGINSLIDGVIIDKEYAPDWIQLLPADSVVFVNERWLVWLKD